MANEPPLAPQLCTTCWSLSGAGSVQATHVEQGYPSHGWDATGMAAHSQYRSRRHGDWLPPPPSTYDDREATAPPQSRSASTDRREQWQGHPLDPQQSDSQAGNSQLRLVKKSSDVLTQTETVAVLVTHGQGTSIGRDKVHTPRIRLPVMEISKHHCNLFEMTEYDACQSFFVADTGSTYGTFILSAAASAASLQLSHIPTSSFDRLSDAKKASTPRRIFHGDLLRVAKTTFEVHIHTSPHLSCDRCSLNEAASNEIKLVADAAIKRSVPRTSGLSTSEATASSDGARYVSGGLRGKGDRRLDAETERRRRMAELQSSYLSAGQVRGDLSTSRPSPPPDDGADRPTYKDRAAQRRALHVPDGGRAAGDRQSSLRQDSHASVSIPTMSSGPLRNDSASKARLSSQPIQSLGDDNRGYQLYKQWYSPAPLDSEHSPAKEGELVLPAVMEGRAGIGSRPLIDPHERQRPGQDDHKPGCDGQASNWKVKLEQSKRRRWEEAQELASHGDDP